MTILSGSVAAGNSLVSLLLLLALLASFCGILYQLTRIFLGAPRQERPKEPTPWNGIPAMGLMLSVLLVFSLWLPQSLLQLLWKAAGIIKGQP
jgi:NADH:ubiquinone oxidoreductase subunit 5 (subunit L)/multisubunit Na+/H+ antiporter MnhA subunit